MSVTDRNVSLGETGFDDLPRTLRRQREEQERVQPASQTASASPTVAYVPEPSFGESQVAQPAIVTAIAIPFHRLVLFFFKAVFAALPALALLGVILWTVGHLLMTYYPWLVKVQILIRLPN